MTLSKRGALIANRFSYPSEAFRRVSGFSANFNLSPGISRQHPQHSVEAHQGKDIWSFKGDVVDGLFVFLSLGIAGYYVSRNALELLKRKADTALVVKRSSVGR